MTEDASTAQDGPRRSRASKSREPAVGTPNSVDPRRMYVPVVQTFLPGVSGTELALRCSMLLMRDRASARARHCHPDALGTLQEIQRLVCQHGLGFSTDQDRLGSLRHALVHLLAAATCLDEFQLSDWPQPLPTGNCNK